MEKGEKTVCGEARRRETKAIRREAGEDRGRERDGARYGAH